MPHTHTYICILTYISIFYCLSKDQFTHIGFQMWHMWGVVLTLQLSDMLTQYVERCSYLVEINLIRNTNVLRLERTFWSMLGWPVGTGTQRLPRGCWIPSTSSVCRSGWWWWRRGWWWWWRCWYGVMVVMGGLCSCWLIFSRIRKPGCDWRNARLVDWGDLKIHFAEH